MRHSCWTIGRSKELFHHNQATAQYLVWLRSLLTQNLSVGSERCGVAHWLPWLVELAVTKRNVQCTCLQDPPAHRRIVIAGEVSWPLTFDRRRPVPMAALPGMAGHTATIGGTGKMFSVTGGKVEIFPFPSRFGRITKTQHFVTTWLTCRNSCLKCCNADAAGNPWGSCRHVVAGHHRCTRCP